LEVAVEKDNDLDLGERSGIMMSAGNGRRFSIPEVTCVVDLGTNPVTTYTVAKTPHIRRLLNILLTFFILVFFSFFSSFFLSFKRSDLTSIPYR